MKKIILIISFLFVSIFATSFITVNASSFDNNLIQEFHFIGITHSEITKDVKNIPLTKNPNPNDKKNLTYFQKVI